MSNSKNVIRFHSRCFFVARRVALVFLLLALGFVAIAGAQEKKQSTTIVLDIPVQQRANPEDSREHVTIVVRGMKKSRSGATWLGWPDGVKAALEGLAGIGAIRVDLANDRFTVGYDPDEMTPDQMLEAIKELEFEPEIVAAEQTKTAPDRTGPVPEPVASALTVAKREGKFVLLDFWAEWCAPCKVLEEKTIADARIQGFLSRHAFLRVDTDADPEAAQYFEAFGLPTIVVLSPDGEEVFRHVGFIEAEKLSAELEGLQ